VIEALLWDNDGVLVDTEHLYFEATRDALAKVEIELDLDLYADWSLRQGRSCFDLARERGVPEARIAVVRDERDAAYHARLEAGVALMDGVLETLSALYGVIPMALVTTTRHAHFDAIHAPHGTHRFFEFVHAYGDYPRTKPHPDPYLTAARRIGLAPEACLAIEDSERGLAAAHAAGMPCLVIPHALTAHGDFTTAARRLDHVREVPDVVAALRGG
jgi:HAD superfamily hydrolase (TIGR01509 family)